MRNDSLHYFSLLAVPFMMDIISYEEFFTEVAELRGQVRFVELYRFLRELSKEPKPECLSWARLSKDFLSSDGIVAFWEDIIHANGQLVRAEEARRVLLECFAQTLLLTKGDGCSMSHKDFISLCVGSFIRAINYSNEKVITTTLRAALDSFSSDWNSEIVLQLHSFKPSSFETTISACSEMWKGKLFSLILLVWITPSGHISVLKQSECLKVLLRAISTASATQILLDAVFHYVFPRNITRVVVQHLPAPVSEAFLQKAVVWWSSVSFAASVDASLYRSTSMFLDNLITHMHATNVLPPRLLESVEMDVLQGVGQAVEADATGKYTYALHVLRALAAASKQTATFARFFEGITFEDEESGDDSGSMIGGAVENNDRNEEISASPIDSDDEIEGYLDHSTQTSSQPQIVRHTLGQLYELLKAPEGKDSARDDQEKALLHLPIVLDSQPLDLRDWVSALAQRLLVLENTFAIEGFSELVTRCLEALTVAAPRHTVLALTTCALSSEQIATHGVDYPLALKTLSLLEDLADVLSGRKTATRTDASASLTVSSSSSTLIPSESPNSYKGTAHANTTPHSAATSTVDATNTRIKRPVRLAMLRREEEERRQGGGRGKDPQSEQKQRLERDFEEIADVAFLSPAWSLVEWVCGKVLGSGVNPRNSTHKSISGGLRSPAGAEVPSIFLLSSVSARDADEDVVLGSQPSRSSSSPAGRYLIQEISSASESATETKQTTSTLRTLDPLNTPATPSSAPPSYDHFGDALLLAQSLHSLSHVLLCLSRSGSQRPTLLQLTGHWARRLCSVSLRLLSHSAASPLLVSSVALRRALLGALLTATERISRGSELLAQRWQVVDGLLVELPSASSAPSSSSALSADDETSVALLQGVRDVVEGVLQSEKDALCQRMAVQIAAMLAW